MKYTYDPATGMPDLTELEQAFEVTLTRRELNNLILCVSQSLDRIRQDMGSTRHGMPSDEPAAYGLLHTLQALSHEAARNYWRVWGHPENWRYRHTPTAYQGENQ
jgi:hypothetical protein